MRGVRVGCVRGGWVRVNCEGGWLCEGWVGKGWGEGGVGGFKVLRV